MLAQTGVVQYLWAIADNMLALEKVLLAGAIYYRPKAQGQQEFTTPGTYSFVVPANVESISMVAVGSGGGGAQAIALGAGGGGGALAYNNNVAVTPGETLTVVVSAGGSPGDGAGSAGGTSSVTRSSVASQIYDSFETVGALGSKWISSQGVTVKNWGPGTGGFLFPGFASSGVSGSSAYLGFGGNTDLRFATTQPQDLTYATKIKIRYIYGNGSNGGEQVDGGEYLAIALSTDNSTYTNILNPVSLAYVWTDVEIVIPSEWKRAGVYIKIYQPTSSGSEFDHIGVDNFTIEYGNRLLVAAGGGQPGVGTRGGNGGVPAGSTSDLYSSSVVLLLTGDGADGSRNFVDSSPNPKTISNFQDLNGTGYPLQTTRFKKFGTGSIDFNGRSSFYVTGGTDFVLGGDFTIEGWLWVNDQDQEPYETIWELGDYRNGILFRFGYSIDNFYINGVRRINNIRQFFPPLQWHHFAVVRSGSTVTVYANGVSISSFTETGVINSNGGSLRVGESSHTGGQQSPPMYLDEFRITKGVARYTSNFTPPTTSSNDTTSLTNFTGFSGGVGGGGGYAGGGGGAGGYTGSGGEGGGTNGRNAYGTSSTGGGGSGGGSGLWYSSDRVRGGGGGGTGLKGISNNGRGVGGGGSSYNSVTDFISSNINSQVDFYPVTLSYAWGNFINTYGVWYDNGTYNRGWYAPYTGTYTMEYTADNYIEVRVDGKLVGVESNFGGSTVSTFTANQGIVILSFAVANYGGPAGFAVTIRDRNNTLLWDTRTYASKNAVNQAIRSVAAGTDGTQTNGGFPGGGGGGHSGGRTAGFGGGGAVRIIWGANRSYPYNANDVTPTATASVNGLILHYDAANVASYAGGGTIYDLSGNVNHGTISLGYAPATVPMVGTNKVIKFPASQNTKIDFSANELTSTIITVEMWALVDDFASGMFFGWNIHDVWTQGGPLGFNTGQGAVFGISAAKINALNIRDRWTHYVFVMVVGNYNQNKIYINGVEQSLSQQYTQQFTGNTNFNSGNGRIGGWRLDNNYQQVMDLGIFKIYNRQLTQAEITTSYNENLARFSTPIPSYSSGLVGTYYRDPNFGSPFYTTTSNGGTIYPLGYFDDSFFYGYFSWIFNGYIQSDTGGTAIVFLTILGSGTTSSLSVGGTVLLGDAGGSVPISLNAGVYYPIQIRYNRSIWQTGSPVFSFDVSGATFHN